MAKYSVLSLELKNGELRNLASFSSREEALKSSNVVYIYQNQTSKKVYIGQTVSFIRRHKEHYSTDKSKFEKAKFDRVLVIFSQYFNRSALDDVEQQLINFFIADASKNKVFFDKNELLNANGGNHVNDYKERGKVAQEVVLALWEKELYPKGWVRNPSLQELRNSALFKYSPFKALSRQQEEIIERVLESKAKNFVINGDAGTGKTVLLTNLASRLASRKNSSIAVVVPSNWKKTANEIFRNFGLMDNQLIATTSTKLIRMEKHYDVILVDEAHKLSRKYGKQQPSFNEVYKFKAFEKADSHLEILQQMTDKLVLMYDVFQAIRPSHLPREVFAELTKDYEKILLKSQFSIKTPKGKSYDSDDYLNGIKYLLYKDTGLLDSPLAHFKKDFNREVFRDKSENAYFGYFSEQPLHALSEWIDEDRNFHPEHMNRILAGLVEDWKQSDGKDASIKHWHEEELSLRWNASQENWLNSKEEDAEEQVGSVFAVQGIDLNKVGVLIGPDIEPDEEGRLVAVPEKFFNRNGKFNVKEMESSENQKEFTLYVLNIYYVLLTRGIDGIRLGFWKNKAFETYMKRTLEIDDE